MNLANLLLNVARTSPERTCLRRVGTNDASSALSERTYGDLDSAAARLAGQLVAVGVEAGDRVIVQIDKSVEGVALYLAVLRLGAVFVPLNVAYTGKEVGFFVEDAEPKLIVGDGETADRLRRVAAVSGVRVVTLKHAASGQERTVDELVPWLEQDPAPPVASVHEASSDELAAILYTSGTTGRSKGAMLTHGNLTSNAQTLCDIWQITAKDVLLHVLPIFHVHGLFVALNTILAKGGQLLFMERFDAKTAVGALQAATVFMGVPTHYTRLLEQPTFDAEACASMRLFTSGSAPLDPVTFEAFTARTGQRILERYGMTEAGMITSNPYTTGSGVGADGMARGERVAGTVGFPLPGVEVEICDDAGQPVGPETVGTLRARGPNIFAGYWRLQEKTTDALTADGWLISGDQATCSREGRISLVGRSSDMIIVGGYNVYPREIEDCLLAVEGVAEAAVIGVPHPVMGEGVVACLVADRSLGMPSVEALKAAVEQDLADFKRPRAFEWIDALPRNAMGKVQKTVLKDRYAQAFAD